jgi:hypothetical protein
MEYRTRNKSREFFYRKSIDSLVKAADPKGATVYQRDARFNTWKAIGAIANGRYFEGSKFVDAMRIFRRTWRNPDWNWKYSYLGLANIIKTGTVSFPQKFCGLDNFMSEGRSVGALKDGPNHYRNKPDSKLYEYVVTPYGYELAEIIKQFYVVENLLEII